MEHTGDIQQECEDIVMTGEDAVLGERIKGVPEDDGDSGMEEMAEEEQGGENPLQEEYSPLKAALRSVLETLTHGYSVHILHTSCNCCMGPGLVVKLVFFPSLYLLGVGLLW